MRALPLGPRNRDLGDEFILSGSRLHESNEELREGNVALTRWTDDVCRRAEREEHRGEILARITVDDRTADRRYRSDPRIADAARRVRQHRNHTIDERRMH